MKKTDCDVLTIGESIASLPMKVMAANQKEKSKRREIIEDVADIIQWEPRHTGRINKTSSSRSFKR